MQILRYILFPFSLLYGLIVRLRNKLFDWNLISSKSYDFPVICVGNLSVGGTGKTPMVEYLADLLKDKYQIATLSRGYKRKTKGFYLLHGDENALQTGDEPLQFKLKFPAVHVAVDENRQNGIAKLRQLARPPEIILLDDAFQHRKVTPGLTVLLTAYNSIYKKDFILPTGNLREPRAGAKRADIVVVTKCPPNLSGASRSKIKKLLQLEKHQSLYFTFINYADFITNGDKIIPIKELKSGFTLVTGIAKPQPLVKFFRDCGLTFTHQAFPDHHNFTANEIDRLAKEEFILTTEKDFMRLKSELDTEKMFYLPIKQDFIMDKEDFDHQITDWVKNNI